MANSRTENLENKYDPIEANTSDFVLCFYSGLPSLAFLYFWLLLHSNCFGQLLLVLLFGQLRKNKVVKWGSQTKPDKRETTLLAKLTRCMYFYLDMGPLLFKLSLTPVPEHKKSQNRLVKTAKLSPALFLLCLELCTCFPLVIKEMRTEGPWWMEAPLPQGGSTTATGISPTFADNQDFKMSLCYNC